MLIGLAHDRIIYTGNVLHRAGMDHAGRNMKICTIISTSPYEEMGGNGSAKKVMQEINKLPIHKSTYIQENQ